MKEVSMKMKNESHGVINVCGENNINDISEKWLMAKLIENINIINGSWKRNEIIYINNENINVSAWRRIEIMESISYEMSEAKKAYKWLNQYNGDGKYG